MGEVCPRRCCPLLRGLERTRTQKLNLADQILSKIKEKKNISAVSNPVKRDSRQLMRTLFLANQAMDHLASSRTGPQHFHCRRTIMGYTFSLSRCGGGCADHGEGATNMMNALKAWLRAHEEAQVMVASVLVVIGMWWLVRTVLALLINLVCPLLVVLVAVMFVCWFSEDLYNQITHSSSNRFSFIMSHNDSTRRNLAQY